MNRVVLRTKNHRQVNQGKSHKEANPVIEDYGKIIRSKRKVILNIAFRQENDFKTKKDLEIR